jgi:hypothetical protein
MMKSFVLIVMVVVAVSALECFSQPIVSVQEESERPEVAKKIQHYLADNFGMKGYKTSWYDNILRLSVRGATVIVKTNLSLKEEKAGRICGAVSGFVFSNENRSLGLENVQVYSSDGQILINRRGLGESCS